MTVDVWKVLQGAARTVDALPVSPRNVAQRLQNYHFDRRERLAGQDPTWAAIEKRRQTPEGNIVMLSDDLQWDDQNIQNTIGQTVAPDPVWLPLTYFLKDNSVASLVDGLRMFWQRGRQGWSDADVVDLGYRHEQVLGEQLLHLAETAHGWPCSSEYETYEDWTSVLRQHGHVLVAHGWMNGTEDERSESYHAALTTIGVPEEERETLRLALKAEEEAAARTVADSLHWVADNSTRLWD